VAHNNLGNALDDLGRLAEAIAAYREALRLHPDHAGSHCNLGLVLVRQGRFAEALAALKRGHELGSRDPRWTFPSAQLVRRTERLIALDARLPAAMKGEAKPRDADERIEFAELCQFKQLHGAAARFYAEAFAAKPGLEDPGTGHRYNAARSAALAGCGRGEDAAGLDGKERTRLRRLALNRLRADLAVWTRLAKDKPPARPQVQKALRHWQTDPDLAGLRDPEALAKLPAAEQAACRELWADVKALLAQTRDKP
jgi:serine/threonine-protein kinase